MYPPKHCPCSGYSQSPDARSPQTRIVLAALQSSMCAALYVHTNNPILLGFAVMTGLMAIVMAVRP